MLRSRSPVRLLLLTAFAAGSSCDPAAVDEAAQVARQVDLVAQIADDVYRGRDNGTAGSLAVQELLIDELAAVGDGLDASKTGRDAYRQPFATSAAGTNLLAVIPGSDLADEYVLVGAHYDHLGAFGSVVFNGATDNAAGVAVVLAVGRALRSLPTPPRRSVILALWDAEEDGLVGSRAYASSPLVPLESTVAYVNLDILGANLLPALRSTTFAVAAESGGEGLRDLVRSVAAYEDLDVGLLTRAFGQERSDHASLLDAGIPSVFFSDSTGGCYHTTSDDIDVVDFPKLRKQSQIVFRLVHALAELDSVPTPQPPSGPIFDDALTLQTVVDRAVAEDLDLLSPGARQVVLDTQQEIHEVVQEGPAAFDVFTGLRLALAAVDLIDVVTSLPCDGFLLPLRPGVDVRPGSEENPVNPGSRGVVPVAVLGSEDFDAAEVDRSSLACGPGGAAPSHREGGHLEDVNEDGFLDLVSHYRTRELGVDATQVEVCVVGALRDGTPFRGCDGIHIVPEP